MVNFLRFEALALGATAVSGSLWTLVWLTVIGLAAWVLAMRLSRC